MLATLISHGSGLQHNTTQGSATSLLESGAHAQAGQMLEVMPLCSSSACFMG